MTRILRRSIISSLMALSITAPASAAEPIPVPVETLRRYDLPAPAAPIPATAFPEGAAAMREMRDHVAVIGHLNAIEGGFREIAQAERAASVSPMMQDLIADFVTTSIKLAAIDASGEAEAVGTVVQDRSKALVALAFYQPRNLIELSAKLSAITEFSEDTERWSIRILAEDASRLAGGAR
jgi:hypothetical protein